MKKFILLIIVSIFTVYLLGQIDFELDFSFDEIEPNDLLIDLWLDDLDNDGISEIFASYRHNYSSWKLVQYDQNGDVISIKNEDLQQAYNQFHKGTVFNMDGSTYLVVAYNHFLDINPYSWINYLHLKIYDWDTFALVDSISYEIGEYCGGNGTSFYTRFIKPIEIQNEQYIYLGLQRNLHIFDGVDEEVNGNTELQKYSFNNNTLTMVEESNLSGNSLIIFENFNNIISSDFYDFYWTQGGGVSSGRSAGYNLNKLSFNSPTNITEVFQVSGSYSSSSSGGTSYTHYPSNICFLNNNDYNYNDFGLLFYYKSQDSDYGSRVNFRNFSPDMSETLWTNNETNIGFDNISASTCVNVNNENHYVMYFRENNLEIRNRINGEIIYNQYSSITPFSILHNSVGELLFFKKNSDETSYDVYILENEIQVSSDNELIIPLKFQLSNYPNPFNPSTTISFSILNKGKVELTVYNIRGQKIKTLINNEFTNGSHSVVWNGDDESGRSVSSGVYLYKLKVNGKMEAVRKCILLK